MITFIAKLLTLITYTIQSLRNINNLALSEKVFFDGRWWYTVQGVADPIWIIQDDRRNRATTHKENLKRLPLWKRFRFSFMATYGFLMQSWQAIDVRARENALRRLWTDGFRVRGNVVRLPEQEKNWT